ncbi:hypothetical protein EVAR_56083_1 [Eumeta japonica]|uniref:Uncharacterized protein n=1 Tax=Eumeta variegata TaxID=151549 RepID=A0A4C1YRD4_EUMVA|nr:hypothetical protein EVAR_56083_1 [Eumeta japonica]
MIRPKKLTFGAGADSYEWDDGSKKNDLLTNLIDVTSPSTLSLRLEDFNPRSRNRAEMNTESHQRDFITTSKREMAARRQLDPSEDEYDSDAILYACLSSTEFDGVHVVSASLDTPIRVWDGHLGHGATLQHTSVWQRRFHSQSMGHYHWALSSYFTRRQLDYFCEFSIESRTKYKSGDRASRLVSQLTISVRSDKFLPTYLQAG